MSQCPVNRDYMKDLRCLIEKIQCTQMEPEICNVSCPPLGCPRGPCPGICRDDRNCIDPCCLSRMPCSGSDSKSSESCSHRFKYKSGNSCCKGHH